MVLKKVCNQCDEGICPDDKYVLLVTIHKDKRDETCFHFKCFVKFWNARIEEKAREIVKKMQSQALGLFAKVKDSVPNFKGMDQLGNMLNLDLNKPMKTPTAEEILDIIKLKDEERKNGSGKTKIK